MSELIARWLPVDLRRGMVARGAVAGAVLLVLTAGTAGAVQQAQDLLGCCVCRATVNGQPNTSKTCESPLTVTACEAKCKINGGTSLVYGNGQSCATGCAGLATKLLPK